MSEFRLFDKGADVTMLLIPGWAADHRVFNSLNLPMNYLMPVKFSPFDFEKHLLEAMAKNSLDKISILGWSMGGFIAFDFLSKHKEMVDSVTFVSVRERYEKEEIDKTRSLLNKNRAAFLYKFYTDCFSKDEKDKLSWFKKNLMRVYLKDMSIETLFEGLDYLSTIRIAPEALDRVKVKFVHGELDRIAPIKEARRLKDRLPQAEFIAMKAAGHMPFLADGFNNVLNYDHTP